MTKIYLTVGGKRTGPIQYQWQKVTRAFTSLEEAEKSLERLRNIGTHPSVDLWIQEIYLQETV